MPASEAVTDPEARRSSWRKVVVKPFLPTVSLALLGGLFGVIVAVTPWGVQLESETGLAMLYGLRGTRSAPDQVVVVSVDTPSAQRLNQPLKPRKWDRRLHARLVDTLSRNGARAIVFDIFFDEPRGSDPEQDRLLADALRRAGNVVLYADLAVSGGGPAHVEKLDYPVAELVEAAAAVAPHVLPKVPARVDQAWLFKESAGDHATLPAVALQQFALPVYERLYSWLTDNLPAEEVEMLTPPGEVTDVSALARLLREIFMSHPDLAGKLRTGMATGKSADAGLIRALVAMYGGSGSRYIDFFGPPHTVRTIPFHSVVNGGPELAEIVSGAAVFVGGSEKIAASKDDFYTVYRQQGVDLSGVEIAATIFGNLLEERSVTPLWWPYRLALVFAFGAAVATFWFWLHPVLLAVTIPLFVGALTGVAWFAFSSSALWLPLAIPLFVQLPFILIAVLAWRYFYTWREREKVRRALRRLLPEEVVTSITKGHERDVESQTLFGVCMATDASRYTELSEQMDPEALHHYLNRYYQTLFSPVRRCHGFVSDVVGDAMLAIWTSTTEQDLRDGHMRQRACRAALEIICQTDEPGHAGQGGALPTRIGLHCGPLSLGHVGAGDHYEYRAVGDTVNTASRLEGLNKLLDTSVLASAAVVEGLEGVFVRELGDFLLKGKQTPITVYELRCSGREDQGFMRRRNEAFLEALQLFRNQQWAEALARFRMVLERFGDDGPSRYYCKLCLRCLRGSSGVGHDGVIVIREK